MTTAIRGLGLEVRIVVVVQLQQSKGWGCEGRIAVVIQRSEGWGPQGSDRCSHTTIRGLGTSKVGSSYGYSNPRVGNLELQA